MAARFQRQRSGKIDMRMLVRFGILFLLLPCAVYAQTTSSRPGSVQGGAPGIASPLPPRDGSQQPQQQAATGSASIQGRVLRADTGAPIPRATVVLVGQGPSRIDTPTVTTDDRGFYQATHLPAGRFVIRASKTGFVTTAYGQRSSLAASNTIVELTDQQALTGADISLPAGAVIEGRVFDEYGEPVAQAMVQLARRRYSNGERRLAADSTLTSITDDLGRFRLYGIAAGAHYVSATINAPSAVSSPLMMVGLTGSPAPTYYPGTLSANDALPITVTAGQEVGGIAIQMSSAKLATISGTVRSASGRPLGSGSVMLAVNGGSRGTSLRPDGAFSFPNIAPGEYTLTIRLTELKEVAAVPVTMAGEDVALSLVARPGATVRGKVVFDDGAPPVTLRPENLRITVQGTGTPAAPLFAAGEQSKINDDWAFELPNVVGSGVLRYSLLGSLAQQQPSPWTLKAVVRRGVDITDTPTAFTTDVDDVEIHITQRINVVNGTLTNQKGDPVPNATIVAFSEDAQRWTPRSRFIVSSRPNAMGQFTLRALPPGRYLVIGVDYLETGDEQDPEILETLRRKATPLTIGDGETKTLDLKLAQD
jgi:hypothetical protein